MHEMTCVDVRDAAAEYALDIIDPAERSAVAAHILRCPECRQEVESMRESAERLLDLVPGTEPPLGFDDRVLERVGAPIGPARRRFRLIATLAAAALLIVGTTFGAELDHSGHSTRPTLAAADFVHQGHAVGEVYLYAGQPPWLEMSVKDMPVKGKVTCELLTSSGIVPLGSFSLNHGSGYWGASDRSGFTGVTGVQIIDDSGQVLATASFA
jgi:hypothetical protein